MTQFPSQTSANGLWTLKKVNRNLQGSNFPTFPGAPTSVTATAGNASAIVTFTAPASTGGSSITSYTVTSSPGGITASGASSPITVTGLTNGTAYTFTVKATTFVIGPASAASNSVTPVAPVNWTRISTIAGDSSTSGTINVSGYADLLVFGIAPGGSGGNSGDDDGGSGGGSGAAQLTGYKIALSGITTIYYSTPNPAAVTGRSTPGAYQGNLQIRDTNSTGTILFELNAGQDGGVNFPNSSTPAPGGLGGAVGTYGSAAGVAGGRGATRLPSGTGSTSASGTANSSGASGGGGGGAWFVSGTNTSAGSSGGSSAGTSVTVSTAFGGTLDIAFTAAGIAGGAGGTGYPSATAGGSVTTANGGGTGGTYAGGGGAGGGIRFFGAGNRYGAGGGGSGGQNGSTGSGKGGAAYLAIYAR